MKSRALIWAGLVIAALVGILVFLIARPRLTDEQVRARIISTIQSEAAASFLVTGSLDITVTTTVENTRRLLPGIADLSFGTSRATVQVPGRVYYGFDVRELDAKDIRISGDTLVELAVPQPVVLSVEPNLEELQVWTKRGWARTSASIRRAEQSALRNIQPVFERQAAAHVAGSTQPRVNTARALKEMLTPVLEAAGLRAPKFSFRVGPDLVLEPR